MNVTIQERTFTLRSEYDITTPTTTLFAQKAFFSLGTSLELRTDADELIATIKGHSLLGTNYDFIFEHNHACNFHCEKFWKGVFIATIGSDTYTFYEHKGLKSSIFQNDRQIAAVTKNSFVIGTGNEYDIRMNADADLNLVLCMVLAINTTERGHDHNEVLSIDFGKLGPEDKPFDESWQPT